MGLTHLVPSLSVTFLVHVQMQICSETFDNPCICHIYLICLGRIIVDAITFIRSGIFVNPSRASPSSVKPQSSSSDSNRSTTYAIQANAFNNFNYAVFTSVLAVTSSNILDLEPQGMFRQITGTLCTQEWERFCAFFCMVFKEQELHAQIYEDAISISTRAKPKDVTSMLLSFIMFASLTQ